ncbi:MAG: GIY-YIG nuclease family protein [Lachnospiraceae bacterium]|nr:GIY-YIG nuclease family protein [Lachnospiraceae bacterium]
MWIYKITNIQNNKVYIGQSIRPIEQRFKRHINDAINNKLDTHFARAIRKYGKDSFRIETIDTAQTQEELNQKEQYWIQQYDSVNNGYN